MRTSPLLTSFGLLVGIVMAATGCNTSPSFGEAETGSGTLVTQTFEVAELGDFESVSVENSFDALVVVGDGPSVVVVVDDNLVDTLDVRVHNRELRIGLRRGISMRSVTLEATVHLPELTSVAASGAAGAHVVGVSDRDLDVRASGASDVTVEGTARSVSIEATGASSVDARLDEASDVDVDVQGASSVVIANARSVSGQLGGASDLRVPAGVELYVSTSGASRLSRS